MTRTLLTVVLSLASVGGGADPDATLVSQIQADERDRIEVIARAAQTVVCLFDQARTAGGSGVLISEDGCGLTNFHVVAELLKAGAGVGGLADGELYPLEILGMLAVVGALGPFDRKLQLPRKPAEFLTQPQRRGVGQVRAADLDDLIPGPRFFF